MELRLKKKPDELVEGFFSLEHPRDVASLLEIPYEVLNYHLYIVPPSKQYITFSVPKKSGDHREILAPSTTIKILQQKLNYILQGLYRRIYHKRKFFVHGFIYGRNICTNAQAHTRKEYVFNIDLLDFFPSINFGRVYGMFLKKPYNLPGNVAAVLSRICIFKDSTRDQLPQGAPTSPIVSNLICARMDDELYRLAREHNCRYTRYADDITFSTNRPNFPKEIATINPLFAKGRIEVTVGKELSDIINNKNGFSINARKVRIQHRDYRQTVTGLKVNEFPNVSRKYINQLRAMLYAWETYGLKNAEKVFIEKYNHKRRWKSEEGTLYKKVVKGKINFLRMVRGRQNATYQKFCEKLSCLDSSFTFFKIIQECIADNLQQAVFILDSPREQGTAFMLEGIGIVTSAHNLKNDKFDTFLYRVDNSSDRQQIRVTYIDWDTDVALIEVTQNWIKAGLAIGDNTNLQIGDSVKVIGYPNYSEGKSINIHEGKVTGKSRWFGIDTINIDANIIYGNSGGPVVNDRNEVVGIAFYGAPNLEEATRKESGVIPIAIFDKLRGNHKRS